VEAFRRKFGREMMPEDEFFFDPRADAPRFRSAQDASHALEVLAQVIAEAGLAPEIVFAFKRTDGLVPDLSDPSFLALQWEWDEAIREYHQRLCHTRAQ
jgi:hypothetical protein